MTSDEYNEKVAEQVFRRLTTVNRHYPNSRQILNRGYLKELSSEHPYLINEQSEINCSGESKYTGQAKKEIDNL